MLTELTTRAIRAGGIRILAEDDFSPSRAPFAITMLIVCLLFFAYFATLGFLGRKQPLVNTRKTNRALLSIPFFAALIMFFTVRLILIG